jgi:SAM-dependent methyltransferase
LALDVLEHIDDDAAALAEIGRLLRSGGLLIVSVPALPILWGAQDEINHHRRRYTRGSLREAFARARLPLPRVTYFNMFLFPVIAAVRWGRRAAGLADRMRTDFDDNRPGLANDLLAAVFASERHLMRRVALPVGVSLLATARVEKPADG